ncbi:MAG: hypothetical protein OES13_02190 [Acidimicrobiia bacterium]|nr:hypothetical protein [Acidimicrobiia bacterium]
MVDYTTLGAAGRIRFTLGEAARRLEIAIASAAMGNDIWLKQVDEDLEDLSQALIEHIDVTESDNGLLSQIIEDAPRLVPDVDVVLADHAEICEAVDLAKDTISHARSDNVSDVRTAALDVLARLYAHRQRGADLVYDAYNVDIGGLSGE